MGRLQALALQQAALADAQQQRPRVVAAHHHAVDLVQVQARPVRHSFLSGQSILV